MVLSNSISCRPSSVSVLSFTLPAGDRFPCLPVTVQITATNTHRKRERETVAPVPLASCKRLNLLPCSSLLSQSICTLYYGVCVSTFSSDHRFISLLHFAHANTDQLSAASNHNRVVVVAVVVAAPECPLPSFGTASAVFCLLSVYDCYCTGAQYGGRSGSGGGGAQCSQPLHCTVHNG